MKYYLTARNNDHGRGDDIILVQIAGDVQIAIFRITTVAKQPSLPRRFKALRERQILVAIPTPKSGYMIPPQLLYIYIYVYIQI